jgi:predicted transposase YbfD/YdcC
MKWQDFFSEVPDFRMNRSKLHKLTDILMLSLCAILSGAEDFEDIEHYGREKEEFLRAFLELPHGIPSHDTINRVFRLMDAAKFAESLYKWSRELLDFMDSYQINIDGKVLRGTNAYGQKKGGLCLVSAWASEQCLSLGQLKTEEKSNEKTAIPALIESLDLRDAIVSIDAIATTAEVAEQIIGKGGDYLLSLKKNQKTIFEQTEDWFSKHQSNFEQHISEDFGSGRIERRACYVCSDITLIDAVAGWMGAKTLIMVEASREKNGQVQQEKRYYLSSMTADAETFNNLVRNHWSIENRLHWHLDVTFREDQCRTRKDNAPENMATLRKIALQALKQEQTKKKESIKTKRNIAAWNDQYLLDILQNLRF